VLADAGRVEAMEEALDFWSRRIGAWVDATSGTLLRHALALETWRSLTVAGGITRPEAVRLMAAFVRLAVEPDRR
jgi:hypothetical protein